LVRVDRVDVRRGARRAVPLVPAEVARVLRRRVVVAPLPNARWTRR
jgi:hypothetical protein